MTTQTGAPRRGAPKPSFTCTICGAVMDDIHCKLICPNCGYTRDCSDP